ITLQGMEILHDLPVKGNPVVSWTDTTKHVLRVFRDALDSMTEDQFIWEPYSSDIIESLPEYCRVGRDIWRARVPIFC
ncbi:hypothetical protein MTR67_005531, partial [Solanum verrucosum]